MDTPDTTEKTPQNDLHEMKHDIFLTIEIVRSLLNQVEETLKRFKETPE